MDKASYEVRIKQWLSINQEANASGLTKSSWCELNGISPRQFYYWQKKVRNFALTQTHSRSTDRQYDTSFSTEGKDKRATVFCELPAPTEHSQISPSNGQTIGNTTFVPELVLQCGSFQLLLSHAITEKTLSTVLSVLNHV